MVAKRRAPARKSKKNTAEKREITIRLKSVDGYSASRPFKTLAGARKFAREKLGQHYDIGSWYAVSGSGTLRMTAKGATLEELLAPDAPPAATKCECDAGYNEDTGRWSGPCDYCRSPAGKAAKAKAIAERERDEKRFDEVKAYAKKLGADRFGDGLRITIKPGEYYKVRWEDVHPADRARIEAKAKQAKARIKYRESELAQAYDFESIF